MAKDLDLSEFGGTPELDLSEFDQPAPQPASTARRAADTGLALGRGIVAVPETAVGLSNIVTGGRTGKAVERLGVRFKDAKQVLTDFQSDEQKAADAQVQQADGFLPTVGAMVENPSTIANAVAESVPSMLAGGAVSRGLVNKGVGAITAGAVGEGVVSAGSAAEQVRQEGATGFLTPKQAALAATSGAATGVINRASGKLADKLGIADVNTTMATGKLGGGTDRGILRRTAYGAVNEGVLQELPQSMQEQALQNLALDKPVGEGVAEAGAAGMLVGNLTGGAFGAVSRSPQTPSIETDSPDVGAVNPPPTAPGVSPSVQGGGIAPPQEPPKPPPAPPPPPPSKAQAMGINPAAGPLQAAAGVTVDTGADVITQDQEAQKQKAEAAAKEKAKPGADGKKPEPEAPPPVQPATPDPTAPITGPFTQAIHGASNVTPPPAPAVDPQGPAATQGAGTAVDAPAAPGVGADQGPQGAGPVPVAVPEPAPAKPSEQPDNGALKTGVEGVSAPAGNYKPGDKLTTNGRTFLVTGVAHTGKTITVKATDGKGFAAGEIPVSQPTQESTNATQQSRPGETIDPETGEITQSGPQGAGGDGGQRPADALQPGADAKGPQPAPGQPTAPAPASTPPEGKPASTAESVAARERKDRWLKNVADAHRLAGSTGVQIGGVVNGRVNFLGNPNATKQGRALQGSVEEAINAGATPQEIVDAAKKPAAPAQPKPPAPTTPVDMGAHTAATSPHNDRPEPTQAQKEAGNAKLGHIVMSGLGLSIENPEGSTRRSKPDSPVKWETTMKDGHYGYVKGSIGMDGDHVDTFIKPGTPLDHAGTVFVIDQIDPATGKPDEHKVMIGYPNGMAARQAYQGNYQKGWKGFKAITPMAWDEFKAWVKSDGTKSPAARSEPAPVAPPPADTPVATDTTSSAVAPPAPDPAPTQAAAPSKAESVSPAAVGPSPDGTPDKPAGATIPGESALNAALRKFGIDPNAPVSKGKALRKEAEKLAKEARDMLAGIVPGQPVLSTRDRNLRERAREKQRKASDLFDQADAADAELSKPAAPAPAKPTGGKNLRAAAYDRNPMLTFLAQHGLFHDKDKPGSQKAEFSPDKQVMVMGYGPVFRKTGLMPDVMTAMAIQDGYLPESASESEFADLVRRAIGGERIAPLYAEGAAETEMQKRMAAVDDLRELDDNEVADLDPDMFVESNVSAEDAMRALGFTDQEIHDATTQGPRAPQEGRQGRGEPDEAQAAGPGQGAQGGPRAPPAEAEPEGLTAPTRADVIAQQDRVENAQALDDKAQIDREADGFQLQAQSVETRKDNTGDMFGGPSVDDYQQDMARRRKPGTEPDGPSLFDQPAEPEQAAITRDEAGNMSRGDIVRDSKGVEYYAWSARFGRIDVMPMQDGKPVVNNASAIRFALDDATKAANPEYRTDPLYLVRKAPAESEPTDEPDRNGLRAADRYARDLASAAQELASQIYGDFNEADFDPAEVLPGLQVFAKDAGVPADELRQAVLKNLRSSTMSRANLRKVEKALDPTKAPVETAAPATAAHKVGDLVKLTKPGVNGRVNIAGTITKILPDGRLEIRTQQDGYMTVAPSELGHKPTAAPATTATTRTRPRDTITFKTPIKGPSGSSLLSYTWQWMPMDVVDSRGEDRTVRVSDWDKADTNAETGREIVHQFVVAAPDGSTQTVSAETAVRLLGFAGNEAAPFKSAASAAKTLAKLRMQAYELGALLDQFTKDHDAVKAMRTPAPKSERNAEGWFEMGDAKVRQLEPGAMLPERLRTLTRAWRDNRLQERGWKSGEATKDLLGSQVADIGQRIKRAEKRIADLGKETPAQEKPGAPPAWHTAIPDHGTKVVPADEKNYSQISHRVATEAVEAVTQTQAMGNMGLYAYVLPSRDGYHGAARLFPDDQTPPAPWTLLFPEAVRMGMMTKEQAIEKLVGPLRRAPILGTMPANAPAPSDLTAFPLAEPDPATQATTILDAANVTGKDRLDILKDVKSGALTPDEVQAAYPAAAGAKPAQARSAPQPPEQALKHAKDLGGRVVWHSGDLALIEGYSLLTGDSVYAAAKGPQRTRVDIASYTGAGFTDQERRNLLEAKRRAVVAAQAEMAANPDGPFRDGALVFGDDIPERVQNVVRGWIPLLGLQDARIVVTTPASGAAMAGTLAGRFRRIGKANLSGDNTNGTMQPLGESDFHVAVRPTTSTLKTLEVLAHELGHIAERTAFAQAAPDVQAAIRQAHVQWLSSTGKGTALNLARSMRALRSGRSTGFASDTPAADASAYWKSFGEWFADQVSRWATTQDKPLGVVGQFFKRLADRLRTFFAGEHAKFLPDATVAQWLDSLSKDVPPVSEPVFSKIQTREDDSGNVAMFARGAGRGVHIDDANAVVAAVREALPTAPPIHIMESVAQAPADLRKFIREAGAQDDFEAAYHNGKIYVLPSNVGSATRLQFLLAHHEIRHHGFASMLGPRKNQVLFSIYATNANVRAAAAEQIRRGYATSKVLATEEALADMAVEDLVKLNGWDKIVAAVRQWLRGAAMRLRRVGLGNVADAIEPSAWTDKDVAALIARAEGVSRGGSAKYASEGTVFGQDGDMPAFYSALTREINANTARAQPALGWASTIQGLVKAGKIKREELEWSGVLDWLRLQEGKVTRDQMVAYLDANGVRVEETVLGGGNKPPGYDADIELLSDNGLTLERNPEDPSMVAFMDENGELLSADELAEEPGLAKELVLAAYRVQEAADADKVPTRYANYQLPGGTNYREVLLTLPAKEGRAWVDSGGNLRGWVQDEPTAEVRSAMEASGLTLKSMPLTDAAGTFKSSHWDQPNVLAHIRVNDRVDADGKKVLFVEELQSDWAQGLRKNGTQTTTNRFSVRDINGNIRGDFATADEADAYLQNPPANMRQFFEQRMGGEAARIVEVPAPDIGIPDGPFVGKTDAWLSLALKRIVKMAVDEGYDRVAFVNGEQSAERYDLSKQIGAINYEPIPDTDLFEIEATDLNGKTVLAEDEVTLARIEELVGKEIAKKIEAREGKVKGEGGYRNWHRLSGLDLKVGGEGMKAFYDKIIPNTLKDVLRKVGGGALETVDFGVDESVRILRAQLQSTPYDPQYASERDELRKKIAQAEAGAGMKQPGFTITPAMKERAANGLPLFDRKTPASTGMPAQKVRLMAAPIAKRLHIDLRVVDTPAGLPIPAPSDAVGLYHNGTIWIVASNVKTRQDIMQAVAHEAVAHLGLRQLLEPAEYRKLMTMINAGAASNGKLAEIRAYIRRTYVDQKGKFNLTPIQEADEIAARVAELGVDVDGNFRPGFEWLKDIFARVVQWLRSKGMDVPFTNAELQGMLVRAQTLLERGPDAAGQMGTAFSLSGSRTDVRRMNEKQIAREIRVLMPRVEIAYAKGNMALAERLDARLETLMEAMESNLLEMQEDTLDMAYDGFNRAVLEQEGQQGDIEADLVIDLANRWLQITKPGSFESKEFPTDAERAATLRALLSDYEHRHGGLKEGLSDEAIIEAAKDAVSSVYGLREARRARAKARQGLTPYRPDDMTPEQIQAQQAAMADAGDAAAAATRAEQEAARATADGETPIPDWMRATQFMRRQSPEFQAWFKGSKVVNPDGSPMVVYHGTRGDFSTFRDDKGRGLSALQRLARSLGIGENSGDFFFAADPEFASGYAGLGGKMTGGNIMPVYLSIKSPAYYEQGVSSGSLGAAMEKAKRDGRDGIIVRKWDEAGAPVSDVYIAFDARQIKSTIGNNGDFNPTNSDIRFARGGLDSVTDKINTTTKSAGNTAAHYRGLGLQALGRRQITELYGDILPQLGSYNTLMAQMDADKNEAGAQADQIAQDWGKLKDERQLAELMHDATLAQMDPEKPLMRGDDPLTYEPLRERYAALSPEAKKVYVDARDAYRTHHENVRKAIRDRIERSELRGQRKAELLKQMDDEFYQSVKGVYFPLARFGDYVVIVRDPTGKTLSVNRAESINEAEALQVELRKAYPEMTVGKVLKSKEFNAGRDAVGRGFMQNLYEALGKADMDDKQRGDLEDMLGQLYLSALPDLSWAKHGIHRKGTPGFSQDARRAFAQNTFHGARYLAKVRYSDLLENELSDAQKQIDGMNESESFDSVKAQQVIDEMVKRHDAAMNPDGNALSTALTSIGFVFHLGLSPASAVVNLTQTALVAYPIMGAKWGFDKAAAALLKASQQAAANRNDISAALSAEEKLAYNEAVRSGVIDVTMAHDLAGISQGEDAKVSWKLRPVMRWASFLFHHAEKFNRQATFVAAYRLAREADTPMAQAYEQAVKATYDGHFDYSAANRPRIMQGNAAKVILLFKQYGQNMVYTLARQAYLSMKGKNQFERAQARKALGGLLTMHAAAAGVLGLPMVSTLLAAASMLGSDDDEPWDAEVALRNMLAEALGDQAADVLARGLSRLTPWDISGRVGLDKLILPDIQEGLEGQRLGESAMAAALGPVAGIGVALLKGMQEISDGNFARGLEAMAPSLLRGPARAVRYASEGAIDKTGKPIVEDVGAFGIAGQALGFSPSEVRLATEAKSAVHQADAKLAKRRATLMRHYAMAVIAGDEDGAADAREDILAFNEKNPGRRINPLQMARSVATRKKQIAESQGGVYLPKTRRDAMEAGQFGMP